MPGIEHGAIALELAGLGFIDDHQSLYAALIESLYAALIEVVLTGLQGRAQD